MSDLTKIAVDAMGGDGSPKKLLMALFIIINQIKKIFLKFLVIKLKLNHSLKIN